MWYHPPRSSLFFIKIIIKQKPNPIIVLLFIITVFPISKQAPAFIKYFPVFWQFQDMKWCLYILEETCILWKAVVICKVVILVFLLCSRVAVRLLFSPWHNMQNPLGEQGWRSGESALLLGTNVASVQLPASTPYASWVCCWFSPLIREVFHRVLWFSSLLKN